MVKKETEPSSAVGLPAIPLIVSLKSKCRLSRYNVLSGRLVIVGVGNDGAASLSVSTDKPRPNDLS